jgi:16S rRNA processing protein RimM
MLLVVARIGRAHGVLGEATIEVRTDQPEDRFQIGTSLITDPANFGPLKIASVRDHNGTLLLGFVGINDRNQVEELRNVLLLSEVNIEDGTNDDDFHLQQLLGCLVVTNEGKELGSVTDVVALPGQNLLAVDYLGREILIPFVKSIVPEVSIKDRKITVLPPLGLLDE